LALKVFGCLLQAVRCQLSFLRDLSPYMIADSSHSLQFITSQWTEVKGPESLSHLLQVFGPGHADIYCWMG
jgi:hypothetical protein